jgi:LysM repeat protein
MFYVVRLGDSLAGIAKRFGSTIETIMEANIICNPNFIFIGQPVIIPEADIDLPKSGGYPYYVVQ